MPKIGVKIGLTLKIQREGKESYEFIRPEIEIKDIEASFNANDISNQLLMSKKTVILVWDTVSELLEQEMIKELKMDVHKEIQGEYSQEAT